MNEKPDPYWAILLMLLGWALWLSFTALNNAVEGCNPIPHPPKVERSAK